MLVASPLFTNTKLEIYILWRVIMIDLDYLNSPKSTKYDPNVSLPDLCIIRMVLPGYGHWGLYYNGTYYDPEYGVLNECPDNAKIFQVWEIYP